ncbi:MAG: tRNA 2-thiouridine(34) synthase MnmA [Deltaproteobacteria bacterium]|nr:tRNA 2-thiouridine(34) synthase MnmA [Deltaproteobacteria bacterium]
MPSPTTPFQTIAVALSGGVDSAVTAWLLQEQGFRVLGLHADLGLDDPHKTQALEKLAAFLKVPLQLIPLERPFRETVVTYLVREYRRGQTPNPCVVCNQRIKFEKLYEEALARGAEGLATGHYARIVDFPQRGGRTIARGLDAAKDQSYFLHRLNPEIFSRVVFPLGEMRKEAVRALANKLGLPIPQSVESQDACFLPPGGYREFLEKGWGPDLATPGEIVDLQGRRLGRHRGLYAYTIGQRRGLGLPAGEPYYVIRMEPEQNRLVIGFKKDLAASGLWVRDLHWLVPPGDLESLEVLVQIRYRHRPVAGTLQWTPAGRIGVRFAEPQKAVTPGQAAVFYLEDRILGGGWIEEAW